MTDTGADSGEKRRATILAILADRQFVPITSLTELLHVSSVTVRADLDALVERGLARRIRGGALAAGATSNRGAVERSFEQVLTTGVQEKESIALVAASLVRSGQSVILDVGTTTAAVATAIADRVVRGELTGVTVVTNGLSIALSLERAVPALTVIVTGGTLRPLQHSLVEPFASEMFGRLRADLAFIGCTGVDAVDGVTNVNLPETALKRAMVAAAATCIVVADSSKLGVVDVGRVGGMDEFDTLVTGTPADGRGDRADLDGALAAVERAGVTVIRAN